MLPTTQGVSVKIPGTNQTGEAVQHLNSFDMAFKRIFKAWPNGEMRMAVVGDDLAYVYDVEGEENLFMMRLRMGSPPTLMWMAMPRRRIDFIVESEECPTTDEPQSNA